MARISFSAKVNVEKNGSVRTQQVSGTVGNRPYYTYEELRNHAGTEAINLAAQYNPGSIVMEVYDIVLYTHNYDNDPEYI